MSRDTSHDMGRNTTGETESYSRYYDSALPAGLYDVAANETWLEEQEAKGWRAVGTTGRRICFEKCAPTACRYRLQPLQKKGEVMDEERISLYSRFGWSYIGKVENLYHVWRCGDATAPELDTDPVVQADGYRYLKRRMMRTALMELAVLLGILALCLWAADGGTALRNILRESVPLETPALVVLTVCVIPWEIMEVRTMRRLLRRLETGISLERPSPYKGKRWVRRGINALLILYFGLRTVSLFWPTGNGEILGRNAMEGDAPRAGMVYVDVTELEAPDDVVEFTCARTKTHELASRVTQVQMRQLHHVCPGYDLVTASADTTYYDLRFSWMASALVTGIRRAYRNWEPFEEIHSPYLDCLFVTSYEDRGNVAIAAKGGKVLELFYSGDVELESLDAYFARLLAK